MPTLIASIGETLAAECAPLPGYMRRPVHPSDIPALGRLYFAAYPAGVLEATAEEVREDIEATFDGRYGALWLAASPVLETGEELACAVLTVRRAPWNDIPDCPFIIEVFTAKAHRRRGLARAALTSALATLHAAGAREVALRVDADNTAAWELYASLGFHPWEPGALS